MDRALHVVAFRQNVSSAWDSYARLHGVRKLLGGPTHLGEEWNRPHLAGLEDVAPEEFIGHLDESIFAPFLGKIGVLVEIGSGGGRFTEVLLPRCEKVIATDTSRTMLRMCRQRFGAYPQVEYVHLDGRGLTGIADGSADAVFSYGVFVHLQHWDIYNYLEETARVLRPGGRAIIQHSDTLSELGWRKFAEVDRPQQLNRPKLFFSLTVMTPELMRAFVERAGLVLVETVDWVGGYGVSLIEKPL